MSWQEIVALSYLILLAVIMLFIDIRWFIKHWNDPRFNKPKYIISKKINYTTKNDNTNNNKEYCEVGLNPVKNGDNSPNNNSTTNSNTNKPPSVPTIRPVTHTAKSTIDKGQKTP